MSVVPFTACQVQRWVRDVAWSESFATAPGVIAQALRRDCSPRSVWFCWILLALGTAFFFGFLLGRRTATRAEAPICVAHSGSTAVQIHTGGPVPPLCDIPLPATQTSTVEREALGDVPALAALHNVDLLGLDAAHKRSLRVRALRRGGGSLA